MNLGTIRREALRLLFASYGDILETHSYTELMNNPQYAPYLGAMDGAINRAVYAMQARGILPKARCILPAPCVTGRVATFNLAGIQDLERVDLVQLVTPTQCATCSYVWEGGTTLVVPLYQEGDYFLVYDRRYTPVDGLCDEQTQLPIPDALASLIPYYVKAELYEEEDAAASQKARRYFEQGLADWLDGERVSPAFRRAYSWEEL